MSWASQRRFLYLTGVGLFFLVVIGGPIAYKILTIPETCFDGIQNQTETAIDRGGPCAIRDERYLQPHAVLWARAFRVRDGSYNAVTYIQNPNESVGVEAAQYRFGLYDSQNVLIAERFGTTYIMPGGITPVLESRIDTGNRIVAHTYFEFTAPLVWKQMKNISSAITINNKTVDMATGVPRVSAISSNTSVAQINNVSFVAVVFDPSGNAIQTSATTIDVFPSDTSNKIVFTWPDLFTSDVGHVEILPSVAPRIVSPLGASGN